VAYLKIAEGCDHACRFCAIPLIRGPKQSRERADIVAEARALAADGVREVVLISQDTTSYGTDRGESGGLTALLRDLLTIPALRWVRLHYLYPAGITPDLIALLAAEPRLCRYLDLPLQHADAAVLKAMGRGGSADGFRRLIGRIRRAVPGVVIRTSFITGFPGETAAQFAVLARFVEEMRFDRMGVFRYSDEEGTAAAALGPKISPRVAESRRARLMALQACIAEEKGQALVGSVQEVLVDGPASEFPDLLCGRTAGHAPEVDGTVYLRGPRVPPGTFVRVRIREAFAHDLTGEILEVRG
jgi:ribosomal protein S12 methylthiotransferase